MICMIQDMFPGLDLYYTDPAQRSQSGRLEYTIDDVSVDHIPADRELPTCAVM